MTKYQFRERKSEEEETQLGRRKRRHVTIEENIENVGGEEENKG